MEFILKDDNRPLYLGRENPHECIRCSDGGLLGARGGTRRNLGGAVFYEIRRCRLCNLEWHEVWDVEQEKELQYKQFVKRNPKEPTWLLWKYTQEVSNGETSLSYENWKTKNKEI